MGWIKLLQGGVEKETITCTGSASFDVKSERHTGREERTGYVDITAAGQAKSETVEVKQSAQAPFVSADAERFTDETTVEVPNTSNTLDLKLYTNSYMIRLESIKGKDGTSYTWDDSNNGSDEDGAYPKITLPYTFGLDDHATQYPIGTNLGETLEHGKQEQYAIHIYLQIPANTRSRQLYRKVRVSTLDGFPNNHVEINIVQKAVLAISTNSIKSESNGSESTVSVTSDLSWTATARDSAE